jgi:Abnormal spindle-like microcephaly-assoc'd, ASPM-SPD-2-Hydin
VKRFGLLLAILFLAGSAFAQSPSIDHISPTYAIVSSSDLTLTVIGSGFVSGNTVIWNGTVALTTVFVSSSQLTATIPAAKMAAIGVAFITVSGTGSSNSVSFRMISPVALVTSWTPSVFTPGGGSVNLTVYGLGFTPQAVIYFDWQAVGTTFISSTQVNGIVPSFTATGPHSIHVINGAPPAPTQVLSLSTQPTAFGNQAIGTTATRTVTVTNVSSSTVTLSGFTVGGVNLTDFANPSNTCGSTLAASASCTASVTFTPSQFGVVESAFLTLTSSAVGSPHSVSLNGTGVATSGATVGFNPATLAFGNVPLTATSGLTLVVTDEGAPNYTTSSIALSGANSGDFSVSPSSCSLVSNVSCNLAIGFAPTVNGPEVATLTITDNSTTSPNVISLSGTGFTPAPGATMVPSSIAFGDVVTSSASAPVTTSLINSGSQTYTISAIAVGGTNSADFAITGSGNCSTSTALAPLQSCPIQVTYTPSGTSTESAYIQITDNATGSPRKLSLSGSGITSAHFMALTWTASSSPSVTGYNVYRGSQSGGPFTLLTPTPISGTAYTDSAVTHLATYFYVITSVGTNPPYNPTESLNSSVVTGTIP